jgi:hypothetical protein
VCYMKAPPLQIHIRKMFIIMEKCLITNEAIFESVLFE